MLDNHTVEMKTEQETGEPINTGLDPWEALVEITVAIVIGSREVASLNRTWDEDLGREQVYIHFTGTPPDLSTEELKAITAIAQLAEPELAQLQARFKEAAEKELEPLP